MDRFRWAGMAILAVTLFASTAEALPKGARVVLVASQDSPKAQRVRDELLGLEMPSVFADRFEPDAMLDPRVIAVVRFHEHGGAALWTPHTVTRRGTLRTVVSGDSVDVLGVRIAEALRVLIREVDAAEELARARLEEPQATSSTPPAPSLTAPPSRIGDVPRTALRDPQGSLEDSKRIPDPRANDTAAERWAVGLDAAVLIPGSSHRVGALALVRGRVELIPHLSLGAFASTTVAPSMLSGTAGKTNIYPRLFGAELRGSLLDSMRSWEGAFSLGMALQWLQMEGQASPPFVGGTDHVFAGLPYASLAGSRRLFRGFWLQGFALLGVSVPKVTVRFGGETVATWGAPLLALGLGGETRF